MLYNFESNKIDYCQEDLFSIENIEKISQFSIPENSFIAEPQILPNVIINKDADSEDIQSDDIFKSKNFQTNINISKESPKEIKFNPTEKKLSLETVNIEKTSKNTNAKSYLSKKSKNSKEENSQQEIKGNKHNLFRKSKKVIFDTALIFINNIISIVYDGNIGHGIFKKELKKIEPFENRNTIVNHNLGLLNKLLKDIFSSNINKKYSKLFPLDFNKKLIEKLLNEEDENKKKIFTNLFNKTVLDWILMLKEPKDELKEIYEKNLIKSNKRDIESLNKMVYIINNYEKEFQAMKQRKKNESK